MIGLGYRKEMLDWDMSGMNADFFEVVPENWIRKDRDPLYRLIESGFPVQLHGVSLNLGGQSPIDVDFLIQIKKLMDDLGSVHYSDHLAASGDEYQLYDLFPIPFTKRQVLRVADRIKRVQDILERKISVENSTWYTNQLEMVEVDFLSDVAESADCGILLDLNNIVVNMKNHGGMGMIEFASHVDMNRVTYMHVAGHEFDERFELFIDTHSQSVEIDTVKVAQYLKNKFNKPVLLEWDNCIPGMNIIKKELECLRYSTALSEV